MASIYTIGHSNRTLERFLDLLFKYDVVIIVDVRRFPKSRFEHFNRESLKDILKQNGIDYAWFESLGGYRKKIIPEKDSPNRGLHSEGFRNYADYMLTDKFKKSVDGVISLAIKKKTAIMCAERLYWKCHRMLISDYLTYKGLEVFHIMDEGLKKHSLSKKAVITEIGVTYPENTIKQN